MALSSEDILRIAHLARIEITPGEVTEVRKKTGIVPMSHAQDVTAPLRQDRVTEIDHHADYERLAPAVAHDLYLVPKVIE